MKMKKLFTSICATAATAAMVFSAMPIKSFASQPPMRFSDGLHNCVFYTDWETGLSYWYENDVRQGTATDPKNIIAKQDNTPRGREIFDPATKAWYWLDVDREGAKATSKEVYIPYIFQEDEQLRANSDKLREKANVTDASSGTEGLGEFLINSVNEKAGKWVRYDANGKLITGWYTEDGSIDPKQKGNTYFYDKQTGLMAKGWITIDGVRYHFNETTGVLDETGGGSSNAKTSYDEFVSTMLADVNALRREQGVGNLILDEQCNAVGSIRVVEIATLFSHTRPDGRGFHTAWDDLGYDYHNVGENLSKYGIGGQAITLAEAAHDTFDIFVNSPTHYENMIKAKWNKVYFNLYMIQKGSITYYYCVQTFSK